jgi:hypothetical protein
VGWGCGGGVTIVLLRVISVMVMVIGDIGTIMVNDMGLCATVRVMSTTVDYPTLIN